MLIILRSWRMLGQERSIVYLILWYWSIASITPKALGVPDRVHTTEKPTTTNWTFASSTNPTEGSGATRYTKITDQKKLNQRKREKSDNKVLHHTRTRLRQIDPYCISSQDNPLVLDVDNSEPYYPSVSSLLWILAHYVIYISLG